MNKAYLLIGGNLGNRNVNLESAIRLLNEKAGHVQKQSEIYETSAWGIQDQPPFLNQALLLATDLNPQELMVTILEIEKMLGRKREVKYGPRIIDIDILLFDDQIIEDANLKIPHPQLPFRKFALVPLNELGPSIVHPQTGQTIEEMNKNCTDTLSVNKKNHDSSL
ncbi:MAG: 2-amino-4-hydroxy-6-hydroxymethyldihydropteridine diphosphokinase [Chitinophagaceae bacterium]